MLHGFIQPRQQEKECAGGPRSHPQCWQLQQGYTTLTEVENMSRVWHFLQDSSRLRALLKGEMLMLTYQG